MRQDRRITITARRTRQTWLFGSWLALLFLLSACSGLQPQRDNPAPCTMGGNCDHSMIERADGYQLGYVQFDDSGHYAQAGQLDRVMDDIRSASTDGLILIGFTHGWKEDSGAERWSVHGFKAMLAAVSERERALAIAQAREPRLVAGIFLGWPGHTRTLPGLTGLTWFNREQAAERIARGDYGDALLQLRQLRDDVASKDGNNQFILVGHSLGASMLYQRLVQEPLRVPGAVRRPIADLVLLLSPAIPAADTQGLEQLSAADSSVLPQIIAITSESDATLRLAFPLGQWLDNPSDGGNRAQLQAMGLYSPLITHRLEMHGAELSLTSTGPGTDAAGLLQVAASRAVMQGHKDIANPNLVDFIADVTALQIDNRLSRTALAQTFDTATLTP